MRLFGGCSESGAGGLADAATGTGLIGAYATFVAFAWRDHTEIEIPAEEVARLDRANRAARAAALASLGERVQ